MMTPIRPESDPNPTRECQECGERTDAEMCPNCFAKCQECDQIMSTEVVFEVSGICVHCDYRMTRSRQRGVLYTTWIRLKNDIKPMGK